MKRLDLVVGPNCAGKSTFIELTLLPLLPGSAVVNADAIALRRWPGHEQEKSYDAAKVAADTRAHLIARGRSFIAETVFSHESKLDLIDDAQRAGFIVALHAMVVPEAMSVLRVHHRINAGGHSVPEDKIRARYHRLWPHVATAVARVDAATLYNTAHAQAPTVIATYTGGTLIGATRWPSWTPTALTALTDGNTGP